MKRTLIIAIILISAIHSSAFAGFLSGNTSPNVGLSSPWALRLNSSILMSGTPFSVFILTGKYAYDGRLSILARAGMGSLDYSTVSDLRLTATPQVYTGGIDYLLSGTREAEYTSAVVEYESATWGINEESNISNETMLGMDFGFSGNNNPRTRYRIAVHNFNAGTKSGRNLASSTKMSVSTEIEYSFTRNYRSTFEAGLYFGDTEGLVTYFGLGFGFNS